MKLTKEGSSLLCVPDPIGMLASSHVIVRGNKELLMRELSEVEPYKTKVECLTSIRESKQELGYEILHFYINCVYFINPNLLQNYIWNIKQYEYCID